MSAEGLRVQIIDKDPLVLSVLKETAEAHPLVDSVQAHSSPEEALRQLKSAIQEGTQPDIVLSGIDFGKEHMDGISCVIQTRIKSRGTALILLGRDFNDFDAKMALIDRDLALVTGIQTPFKRADITDAIYKAVVWIQERRP